MIKFRTEYEPQRADFTLNPAKPTVLLGSCFSDNLGRRMRQCLWEAENPLGTLYNPLSIAEAIYTALDFTDGDTCLHAESSFSNFEESLFEADGVWRTWLFDSKMSAEKRDDVIWAFSERSRRLDFLLKNAEALFVTFGSAWCYYLNDGKLVANCHKQPAAKFSRRMITVEEITKGWTEVLEMLKSRYPDLKVVFTVSPVRHLKDGFSGNSRSKATLLLAVEDICRQHTNCSYFPAFEIVNDDLRDYRFFASDLVHPSDEAVEYIWEIFKATYIDNSGLARLKEGEAIRKGLDHRPLPNATRQPSPESIAKEKERIANLEKRLHEFQKKL